jgi:acetyltransferase-like isoleucine patch superfamily enzyme
MTKYWTDFTRNPFIWITGEPEIGDRTWIGPFTVIDGEGGLKIGDGCSISAGAHIYTHEMNQIKESSSGIVRRPVTIGDNVYIGANAVVMMGSEIGNGATIGAGSVVTKDTKIRDGETWTGVPAHVSDEY